MKLSGNALAFTAFALLSVLCLMALLGVGMPGVPVLMLGLAVSIPFWLLVVFPIYLLSGCGKRWSLLFTVAVCYLTVAAGFVRVPRGVKGGMTILRENRCNNRT